MSTKHKQVVGGKSAKTDEDDDIIEESETSSSDDEKDDKDDKDDKDEDVSSDKEETESEKDSSEDEKNASDKDDKDDKDDTDEQITFSKDDGKDDESCIYKIKRKNDAKLLESDDLEQSFFENESNIVQTRKIVKPEERITKNILTKYERVRLLSERRKQLILGAKPMVKLPKKISEKDIAVLELKSKVMPLIIVRELPNGDIEHWKLSELEIVN